MGYYIIGQLYANPCFYTRLMIEFPVLKISKKPQIKILVYNTKLVWIVPNTPLELYVI